MADFIYLFILDFVEDENVAEELELLSTLEDLLPKHHLRTCGKNKIY